MTPRKKYAGRKRGKISNFLVKREIWITKEQSDRFDQVAAIAKLSPDLYLSMFLWTNEQGLQNTMMNYQWEPGEFTAVPTPEAADIVARLILATVKRGILYWDLAMICYEYDIGAWGLSAALTQLWMKKKISAEETKDGWLFKLVTHSKVAPKFRVDKHRGQKITSKVKAKKMIGKTLR
jgi:hypothetical protein